MKRLLAVTLAVCLLGCGKPAKPAHRTVCFKHIMTNGYEIVPFTVGRTYERRAISRWLDTDRVPTGYIGELLI